MFARPLPPPAAAGVFFVVKPHHNCRILFVLRESVSPLPQAFYFVSYASPPAPQALFVREDAAFPERMLSPPCCFLLNIHKDDMVKKRYRHLQMHECSCSQNKIRVFNQSFRNQKTLSRVRKNQRDLAGNRLILLETNISCFRSQ